MDLTIDIFDDITITEAFSNASFSISGGRNPTFITNVTNAEALGGTTEEFYCINVQFNEPEYSPGTLPSVTDFHDLTGLGGSFGVENSIQLSDMAPWIQNPPSELFPPTLSPGGGSVYGFVYLYASTGGVCSPDGADWLTAGLRVAGDSDDFQTVAFDIEPSTDIDIGVFDSIVLYEDLRIRQALDYTRISGTSSNIQVTVRFNTNTPDDYDQIPVTPYDYMAIDVFDLDASPEDTYSATVPVDENFHTYTIPVPTGHQIGGILFSLHDSATASNVSGGYYYTMEANDWQSLTPPIFTTTAMEINVFDNVTIAEQTTVVGPDRYWVGGTGNYSDTAHWSTSSGGAGGAPVPTSADNIFFDDNSGLPGTVTLTTGSQFCKDFTATNTTALTITSAGANFVSAGNMTADANTSFTGQAGPAWYAQDSGSYTWDLDGATLQYIEIASDQSGPTISLVSNISTPGYFYMASDGGITFDANGFNVTSNDITLETSGTGGMTVNMGSGIWTFTGNDANANSGKVVSLAEFSATSPLTLNAETSTIKFTNSTGAEFISIFYNDNDAVLTGKTLNNIVYEDCQGNQYSFFGDFVINELSSINLELGGILSFLEGSTTTFTNFNLSGENTTNLQWAIQSHDALGVYSTNPHTLSQASGALNVNYLYVENSIATGGATWYAGDNSENGGGNSGWTFPFALLRSSDAQLLITPLDYSTTGSGIAPMSDGPTTGGTDFRYDGYSPGFENFDPYLATTYGTNTYGIMPIPEAYLVAIDVYGTGSLSDYLTVEETQGLGYNGFYPTHMVDDVGGTWANLREILSISVSDTVTVNEDVGEEMPNFLPRSITSTSDICTYSAPAGMGWAVFLPDTAEANQYVADNGPGWGGLENFVPYYQSSPTSWLLVVGDPGADVFVGPYRLALVNSVENNLDRNAMGEMTYDDLVASAYFEGLEITVDFIGSLNVYDDVTITEASSVRYPPDIQPRAVLDGTQIMTIIAETGVQAWAIWLNKRNGIQEYPTTINTCKDELASGSTLEDVIGWPITTEMFPIRCLLVNSVYYEYNIDDYNVAKADPSYAGVEIQINNKEGGYDPNSIMPGSDPAQFVFSPLII